MSGITLDVAQARLTLYLEAEAAVLANQSYEIAGRRLTRADLEAIQAGIRTWDERCKALGGATTLSGRVARVSHGW